MIAELPYHITTTIDRPCTCPVHCPPAVVTLQAETLQGLTRALARLANHACPTSFFRDRDQYKEANFGSRPRASAFRSKVRELRARGERLIDISAYLGISLSAAKAISADWSET